MSNAKEIQQMRKTLERIDNHLNVGKDSYSGLGTSLTHFDLEQATQTTALHAVADSRLLLPHEMTLSEFTGQAIAEKLQNHGRQWQVTLGDRYSSFSDAKSSLAAIADVHHAAVNNALYMHTPGAPDVGDKPVLPPAMVLFEYPDLVEKFSDALPNHR